MATKQERFANTRTWVVVGVNEDPERWGNKIFRSLLGAGYDVHGVNVRGGTVAGRTIAHSLADVPVPATDRADAVVDFVVHPKVVETAIQEAHRLGYRRFWMQPGAESDIAIAWAESQGCQVVHHDCILHNQKSSW
jgi:predicted CoA-binding protein